MIKSPDKLTNRKLFRKQDFNSVQSLAKMIDHTNVRRNAKEEDIENLCNDAKKYGFACVCVTPVNVALSRKLLECSDVKVCAVIGFPFGINTPKTKAFEAKESIENGGLEIDMVINIGALKSGNDDLLREDIKRVVKAADKNIVKVILETGLLSEEEKIRACLIAKEAGADFIKTSTGFGVSGATLEDVTLIRKTVGPNMGTKASGGIRDLKTTLNMIDAGATRIGTSTSVQIMEALENKVFGA